MVPVSRCEFWEAGSAAPGRLSAPSVPPEARCLKLPFFLLPMQILLGVTDGESAQAAPTLAEQLSCLGEVKTVLTGGALQFLEKQPSNTVDDHQEWYQWRKVRVASWLAVHSCLGGGAAGGRAAGREMMA